MTQTAQPSEVIRPRSGHCLCGSVQFTVSDADPDVGACHCNMCQRWTGSALMTLTVSARGLHFEDDSHLTTYASSPWAERAFCSQCGSGVYYRVTAPGPHQGVHYLAVGLLEDVAGLRLGHEIFHDKRLSVFDYAGETRKQSEAEVMAQFAAQEDENNAT